MKRRLILPDRSLYVSRRKFLSGLGATATLFAAPSIVRVEAGWQTRDSNYNQNIAAGGSLGLQTNLASFFSLDNVLTDSTGNVTALTNNNSVTFVSPPGGGLAAVTNCANFVAASSQYLSHADATGINIVGVDSSIQFWYYATGNSNFFASKSTGGFGSREYQISYGFGTGSANPISTDINNGTAAITANVSNSAWHHYVLTRNNSTNGIIVYIDGSSAATASSGAAAGTSQLNIGANATPGNYWLGNIALFGTWRNRILSPADVTLLYNSGAGRSYAAMA